ncbi:MAG: hypothetical protein ABSC55_20070 [Syntrophorhabdales bacterium]|jgi:hypothetical protein
MMRLLIEDVTLIKDKEFPVHVRFKGGAVRSLCPVYRPAVYKFTALDALD